MKRKLLGELRKRLDALETVMVATVLGGDVGGQALLDGAGRILAGEFESDELAAAIAAAGRSHAAALRSARQEVRLGERSHDVFFEVFPPPPQVVVIGAVHVAIHLTSFAKRLGFRTVVIDPRTAFATPARFPDADELLLEWPAEALAKVSLTENCYFAMLSHDLKIDLPALEIALASPARYVGALGSKKTHAKRVRALEERGVSAVDVARIHNPIGLDLGGRAAEEIALAIIAEMVAVRHGRS